MIALALVSLGPVPGVTILVVVAFTLSGFVLSVSVGALAVPAIVTPSSALAWALVLLDPQADRKTRGMTATESIRRRDRRTRGPLIVGTGISSTISSQSVQLPTTRCEFAYYIPSIRRSTRASTAANGSLHRTVRCAWSLSLRCTQSTVKSRLCSWAARMKSPRSLALVVWGGTVLASKISESEHTRAALPWLW